MRPALYVFEGPDGVGKSSLASALRDHLSASGSATKLFSFPGREPGTLGEHIYRLYHHPEDFGIEKISIVSEQLLFTAAHSDVIEHQVLPTLKEGCNVVLDRYWWSTWVYASIGGLDVKIRDLLVKLELEIWHGLQPDRVFLVHRTSSLKTGVNLWADLVSKYNEIGNQQSSIVDVVKIDNNFELAQSFNHLLQAL